MNSITVTITTNREEAKPAQDLLKRIPSIAEVESAAAGFSAQVSG